MSCTKLFGTPESVPLQKRVESDFFSGLFSRRQEALFLDFQR